MFTWSNVLWVAIGGALGSSARYLVAIGALRWWGAGWPLGTFIVNVAGSLLLGGLIEYFLLVEDGQHPLRHALTTGMMGGFTTYSTFNYEVLQMLESGRATTALGYMALTVAACMGAGALGVIGVRWMGT